MQNILGCTTSRNRAPFLRIPPLRVISALHLQIVPGNRRFQSSISYELWPVNAEPAANGLFMRSRYREVCRLLMQQEHVTMSGRRTSWRCRAEVRRWGCRCCGEDGCTVLLGARWRIILQERMQHGCRPSVLRTVDVFVTSMYWSLRA
jgi:hypothetical protein